jgi:hypothetical protein
MHSLLLAALISLGASSEGAAAGKDVLPPSDGTLLFLENCKSVVEWTTKGDIAHVALIFGEGDERFVYEATPSKVRRLPLGDYYAELARLNKRRDEDDKIRVLALHPQKPYTAAETAAMRSFLEEQLGSRYSVRDYVRSKPSEGVHCAELASRALNRSGRYAFERCHKIHPQALYTTVLPTHLPPREVRLPPPVGESWYVRTKRRTSGWFTWCGWSCREAWAWCW